MARSMPAPWLLSTLTDILESKDDITNGRNMRINKLLNGRVVQVVSYNLRSMSIVISDKENTIHVFLTKKCFDELTDQYPLDSLKYSQVKIDKFHFSTVIQAGGHHDMRILQDMKISFPFALQCSKLTYMGANDCTLIGEPVDLNSHISTRNMIRSVETYIAMAKKLVNRQFPDGLFGMFQEFSDDSPPLWRYNLPSAAHREVLLDAAPKDLRLERRPDEAPSPAVATQKSPVQDNQKSTGSNNSSRQTRGRGASQQTSSPAAAAAPLYTAEEESEQMSQMCYGESWNERESAQTQFSQSDALVLLQRYHTQQDAEEEEEESEDEMVETGGLSPVMELSDEEEEQRGEREKDKEKEEDSDSEQALFVDEYDERSTLASQRPSPSQTVASRTTRSTHPTQQATPSSQLSALSEDSGRSSRSQKRGAPSTSSGVEPSLTPQKRPRGLQEAVSVSRSVSSATTSSSINLTQDTASSSSLLSSTSISVKRKKAADSAALKVADLLRKLQPAAAALESQASQRREESQSYQSQAQSQSQGQGQDAFHFDSQILTQVPGSGASQQSSHQYNSQFQTQQHDVQILSQDDILDLEAWLGTQHGPLIAAPEVPLSGSTIASGTPSLLSQTSLVAEAGMLSAALTTNMSSPQSSFRNSGGNASSTKKHVTIASAGGEANNASQTQSFSYASQMPGDSQPSQQIVLINDNQHAENAIVQQRRGMETNPTVVSVVLPVHMSPVAGAAVASSSSGEPVADPDLEHPYIGRDVQKHFVGFGTFLGVVTQFDDPYFMVEYSDGDREEMTMDVLHTMLVPIGSSSGTEAPQDSRQDEGGDQNNNEDEEEEVCTQPQYTTHSDDEQVGPISMAVQNKSAKQTRGNAPVSAAESEEESAEQFTSRVNALLAISPAQSTASSSNRSVVPTSQSVQKRRAAAAANALSAVLTNSASSKRKRAINSVSEGNSSSSGGGREVTQRPEPRLSVARAVDPARRHTFLVEELAFLERMRTRPEVPFRGDCEVLRPAEQAAVKGHPFIDDVLEFIFRK